MIAANREPLVMCNGVVSLRLSQIERSAGLAERLAVFLAPAFRPAPELTRIDIDIVFEPFETIPPGWFELCDEPLLIRHSSKTEFDLHARRGRLAQDRIMAIDEDKRTALLVDHGRRLTTAYVTSTSYVHLIEFIRYGALLLEDHAGTMLLHASAAVGSGGIVMIVGEKGAGKTTTLFKLIFNAGLGYYSGDKVLLRVEDRLATLRAWPDYPHLGIGMMRAFAPALAEWRIAERVRDCDRLDHDEKILLDVEVFRRVIPPGGAQEHCPACILFPNRSASRPKAYAVPEGEKTCATLAGFVEQPRDFTPARWHGLFAAGTAARRRPEAAALEPLLRVPWYRIEGHADVPREWVR
jgi:hypothetical protein